MRLLSLALRPYGAYRDEAPLRLDPSKRLHIIHGLNESGKTTRRDAVTDLFFGFGHQTPYDFAYKTSDLRIAAEIEADGALHAVERRKGRADTLRDATGDPIPEERMRVMLGGMDRDAFAMRFSFGAAELEQGRDLLLSSGGDLGYSLYAAALGGADAQATLLALEREAETLFKPRGQTMLLNASVARHTQALKKVSELAHPPEQLAEIEEHGARITERLRAIDVEQARMQQRHARVEAIVNVIEQHQAYRELRRLIAEAQARERVPDEVLDDLCAVAEDLRALEQRELTAREALARIDSNPLFIDAAVLDAAEEIEALIADSHGILKSLADVREQRIAARKQAASEEYRRLRDRYWSGIDDATLQERQPSRAHLAQARKAASDHAAMIAKREAAERAYEKAQREWENEEKEQAENGPATDTSALRQAVETARALGGSPDVALAGLESAHATRRSSLKQRLAASRFLGYADNAVRLDKSPKSPDSEDPSRSSGESESDLSRRPSDNSLEDILKRRFPISEEIDRACARDRELSQQEQTLRDQRVQAVEALEQAERIVREHDAAGALGMAERLAAARTAREDRFNGVEHAWRSGLAYDEQPSQAYREAANRADRIADERHDRAEAFARADRALADRDTAKRRLEHLDAAFAQARLGRDAFQASWKTLWEPARIIPDEPEIMRAWLTQIKALIDKSCALAEKATEIVELRAQRDACRSALHAELILLRQSDQSDEQRGLDALIARATQVIECIRDERVRREQVEKQRGRAIATLEAAEQERRRVTAERDSWEQQKREALQRLHLPLETNPEIIPAMLEDLGALFAAYATYQNDNALLESVRNEEHRFRKEARILIIRVAPDLDTILGHALPEALKQLRTRLQAARAAQAQHQEREKQTQRVQTELEGIENQVLDTRERRDALLLRFNIPPDGLDARIIAAHDARRLRIEGEREERALRLAARCSIEEIDAEMENHGYENLRTELLRTRDVLEQLQAEREDLIGERRQVASQRADLDRTDEATQAQGDALAIAGEIDRHARRYAALVIARTLLKNEVDRYARTHQAPILTAASRYIARLTEGRHTGIRVVGADQERPTIEILHAAGERTVDQLSDGTRDQVFLALRLAVLEEYLQTTTPLPLLIDDALLTFDDLRTGAALATLHDFASRTQVIYFTHHRRVGEIASTTLGDAVDIVEIPEPAL